MSTYSDLLSQFNSVLDKHGEPVLITWLTSTFSGTTYDDEPGLTTSGNSVWVQGMTQNPNVKSGYDRFLLEQGKILIDDRVIFFPGSFSLDQTVRFGTGSPTPSRWFSLVEHAPTPHFVNGSVVYKKCYIRALTAGLFLGESGA